MNQPHTSEHSLGPLLPRALIEFAAHEWRPVALQLATWVAEDRPAARIAAHQRVLWPALCLRVLNGELAASGMVGTRREAIPNDVFSDHASHPDCDDASLRHRGRVWHSVRFELIATAPDHPDEALPQPDARSGSGRAAKPQWHLFDPFSRLWLRDNGVPVRGDGKQTEFEQAVKDFLAKRGEHPAESTIRAYVKRVIAEYS